MARISRPMTNVALRLLAWVLNLSLIATCRATSPACEITFDNAIESFASINWNLCPPLSFRASMSGFCLSTGCNQASHAARSPSLAARHTLLIRSDCQTPKFWCFGHGLMYTLSASRLDILGGFSAVKAVVDSKSIAESLCDPRSEGKPGGLGGPGGPLGSGGPSGKSGSLLPLGLR